MPRRVLPTTRPTTLEGNPININTVNNAGNGSPDLDPSININYGRRDGKLLNPDDEDEKSEDEDWNEYVRLTGWRSTGECPHRDGPCRIR